MQYMVGMDSLFSQKECWALQSHLNTFTQHPFQPLCRKANQLLGVMSVTMEKDKTNRCL